MSHKIDRKNYSSMFGPTVGDKVRLGDTDLWIEIEKDFTVYGDELKFGGSKSIRDGMGQKSGMTNHEGALDFCLTNAIVLEYWGIVKADIGIKDGKLQVLVKRVTLIQWMALTRDWLLEPVQKCFQPRV